MTRDEELTAIFNVAYDIVHRYESILQKKLSCCSEADSHVTENFAKSLKVI